MVLIFYSKLSWIQAKRIQYHFNPVCLSRLLAEQKENYALVKIGGSSEDAPEFCISDRCSKSCESCKVSSGRLNHVLRSNNPNYFMHAKPSMTPSAVSTLGHKKSHENMLQFGKWAKNVCIRCIFTSKNGTNKSWNPVITSYEIQILKVGIMNVM